MRCKRGVESEEVSFKIFLEARPSPFVLFRDSTCPPEVVFGVISLFLTRTSGF